MLAPVPHHDLVAEQARLDHAHDCLEQMRARAAELTASYEQLARAGDVDAARAQAHLHARLVSLDERRAALCFGRIDEAGPRGESWYIGRRHVEDPARDPVIVDWRAPVAAPFYRATAANALDLHLRRRFVIDGRELLDLFEEIFDDPDHPELASSGGVADPLLAELERSRAGQLRDIVATIQAEQDIVIRAPLDRPVIVQGGPGTGKTAVGLHRAAFLLYEHRRAALEGARVLVLGPNRLFLRYIGEVLPSLGETAVSQHTVESLAGARYRIRGVDDATTTALKGDARMATVLVNLLHGQVAVPKDTVRLPTTHGTVVLEPDELGRLVSDVLASTTTFANARDVIRRRLEAAAVAKFSDPATGAGPEDGAFLAHLRGEGTFSRLLAKLTPSVSAPSLVRRLLGSPTALRRAAAGVLEPDEVERLRRPSAKKAADEAWTAADLPLLDEAEVLINGTAVTYLHAVVDEAQDLSPMALRMVARRVPSGSLTVLGDLAQATAPASASSWADVAQVLGVAETADRRVLEVGYRLPGEILDWAAGLLPMAAPGVPPTRSVRRTGRPPVLVPVAAGASADVVADAVAVEAGAMAGDWGLVGVVVPASLAPAVHAAVVAAGLDVSRIDPELLDHHVNVLTAEQAKGLEFDATCVVEPAAIVEEQSARALYVGLTRCVQELRVVHARPLPPGLDPVPAVGVDAG